LAQDPFALSIRNGWVGGEADNEPHGQVSGLTKMWPIQWNLRTGAVHVAGELDEPAEATNAQGWQISTDKKGRAVLTTGTATIVLPPVAPPDGDDLSTIPNAVSDDGRVVVGQSDDASGTIKPIEWRCH
jgi:hypothetical protein